MVVYGVYAARSQLTAGDRDLAAVATAAIRARTILPIICWHYEVNIVSAMVCLRCLGVEEDESAGSSSIMPRLRV